MNTETRSAQDAHQTTIVLRVRYAPVKSPMVDPHASENETLGQVKAVALQHFHLAEGPIAGGTKTYQLSYEDVVQTDLSLTLNRLIGHGHGHGRELELLLIEQFVQG